MYTANRGPAGIAMVVLLAIMGLAVFLYESCGGGGSAQGAAERMSRRRSVDEQATALASGAKLEVRKRERFVVVQHATCRNHGSYAWWHLDPEGRYRSGIA
jgi:hypothetical protein